MSAIRTLNLGAGPDPGSTSRAGAVTVDRRPAAGVDVAADPRQLPFPDGVFLEIHTASVVERLADPYAALDEIHRVLRHTGRVQIRVPSPWSVWGQVDRSNAFLADLRLWREILGGYFDRVDLVSEGALFRDNALLRGLARVLIRVLRWHELAEMWRFECREKLPLPQRKHARWPLDDRP